ncbi:hypothetical protein GIB67_010551 [Kingdonia uniflora]|uniref:Uncharacterized protein n=1 Tax=Kingdonia uniflora TaxID=39325 RepID=A0A7J7MAR9_9MAGN|nr:hypothetical protein GIB67_010551 [Kingdonia uniflora]
MNATIDPCKFYCANGYDPVSFIFARWYAKRFLHPDVVAAYEYIFIWDEDLGVEHFNVDKYQYKPVCLSCRKIEEKPGWCTDPHLPPCTMYLPPHSIKSWLVFEHLCWHDSVSFVAMIFGFSRNNVEHGALNVFIQMLKSGITPTPYAFSAVLCLNLGQSSKLRLWEYWHFNLGQKGLLQALGGWYAKRFLHPDVVAAYEYIFIWDKDLRVEHFNEDN